MELLSFTLLLGLAVGHFVFIFTKTDFVVEYAKQFGLGPFFDASQYEEWKNLSHDNEGYHVYLRETYHNFWSRLVGCPFCLTTFSCVALSVLSFSFWFLLIAFASAGIASLLYLALILLYKQKFS